MQLPGWMQQQGGAAEPHLTFPAEHDPPMLFNSLNPAPASAPALLPFGIFTKPLRYLRKGGAASPGVDLLFV